MLTYDSPHSGEDLCVSAWTGGPSRTPIDKDLLGIDDPAERARIVIGGIEGGKFWHDELKRPPPPIEVASIKSDVGARIRSLRVAHPEIVAILSECAAFPMVAPAIRCQAKLPVYDITDLCRLMIASVARLD